MIGHFSISLLDASRIQNELRELFISIREISLRFSIKTSFVLPLLPAINVRIRFILSGLFKFYSALALEVEPSY